MITLPFRRVTSRKWIEFSGKLLLVLILCTVVLLPTTRPVTAYTGIPTFSIVTVVEDTTVTIKTSNFPANETFTVRMGPFGTLAIGGTVVGTTPSGAGGSFEVTYDIPAALAGSAKIAIRMDSTNGYYSYNWFYNNVDNTPVTPSPVYTGIPTFSIVEAVEDTSVKIRTNNFPADTEFTVRMGPYGTKAIGGVVVGTTNSGAGGIFEETYTIPAALAGSAMIAIRMDSPTGYYYAYNWFYNSASGTTTPTPGYTGIPTFSIVSAVTDTTVTIKTNNFPPDEDFVVRMGPFGTKAIGGTVVTTTPSGAGGSFEVTYDIPAGLAGSDLIAIRMDSDNGYYAYNWFYNDVSAPTPGYTGIPTITILSAVKDVSVTIRTNNFPPNQDFTVRMGPIGTKAVGGTVVATTPSGAGGTFEVTYDIPAGLAGSDLIAIRLDSANGYYYSYNWFYNN
jgi:hypothetical protein